MPKLSHILPALVVSSLAFGAAPAVAQAAGPYYVAPGGSDNGPGTATRPFATVTKALAVSAGAETINVAPGSYPAVTDTRRRTALVTVKATGARASTVLEGIATYGARAVRFDGFTVRGSVRIDDMDWVTGKPASERVDVRNSDLSSGNSTSCVWIRDGAKGVVLWNNYIHDCETGVSGPGFVRPSSDIEILRNTMRGFTGDGIQFGDWSNVVIDRNTITDAADPAGITHNDGIQITGDASDISVTNNELARSTAQLLMVDDTVGPVRDVVVDANRIHDAQGIAVQIYGGVGTRITNNVVTQNRWGALRFGRGRYNAGDGVVTGNTLEGWDVVGDVQVALQGNTIRGVR